MRTSDPGIIFVDSPRHSIPEEVRELKDSLMSRRDLADFTGLHLSTIDRWVKDKVIKSYKVGSSRRFRKSDVVRQLGLPVDLVEGKILVNGKGEYITSSHDSI